MKLSVFEKPETISTRQVADMLGVAMPTVLRWARERRIGSIRIGYRFRFRREEIEAFMQKEVTHAEE